MKKSILKIVICDCLFAPYSLLVYTGFVDKFVKNMLTIQFFIITAILFGFGAVLGSFLNVYIYRSMRSESWVVGRSKCESCKKKIAWYDNVPLVSYLLLRRKCRYCKVRIPLVHPVVEFLTGSLFVWWYWGSSLFFQLTQDPLQVLQPLFWLLVGVLLLVVFFADLLYFIIPDLAVIGLFFLTLLYRVVLISSGVMQWPDFVAALMGMVILVAFFASLWLLTKGKGFGFGDVKLVAPLALLLGWPKIGVGIFMAFVIGAGVGVTLIIFGKKKFGQQIPFGPFLVIGTALSLLWGESIWQWYMNLI